MMSSERAREPDERAERVWGMPCYCEQDSDIPCMVCQIAAEIRAAVGEERERCAGIAAGFCEPEDDCDMVPDRLDLQCDGCRIAAAIRGSEG